jgi:hypothetical protein
MSATFAGGLWFIQTALSLRIEFCLQQVADESFDP